jgi:hypothetical protein
VLFVLFVANLFSCLNCQWLNKNIKYDAIGESIMGEENKNMLGLPGNTVDILKEVKTPLSFLTLVVIIMGGLLVYLAQKADGVNYTILLIAILLLISIPIIFVTVLLLRGTNRQVELTSDEKITTYKYDVFLSMPMASLNDADYVSVRKFGLDVTKYLREHCNQSRVKFVGEFIEDKGEFDPNDTAVLDDLEDIKNSKYFVMIYPERIVTSVLVEAGIALALGKVCRYFAKSREDLPFLMQQSEQAFTNVRIYEYADLEDIKKVLIDKRCFDAKF